MNVYDWVYCLKHVLPYMRLGLLNLPIYFQCLWKYLYFIVFSSSNKNSYHQPLFRVRRKNGMRWMFGYVPGDSGFQDSGFLYFQLNIIVKIYIYIKCFHDVPINCAMFRATASRTQNDRTHTWMTEQFISNIITKIFATPQCIIYNVNKPEACASNQLAAMIL